MQFLKRADVIKHTMPHQSQNVYHIVFIQEMKIWCDTQIFFFYPALQSKKILLSALHFIFNFYFLRFVVE